MHVLTDNLGFLLQGVLVTLELTLLGFVGAVLLGTLLAVCRVGPITPLRVIGTIYVEFFRNIPLLSLLVLFIFGLPDAGVTIPLFASAAICLALSSSAFVCEAMRGGINSVSVGQAEAARAIGLSFTAGAAVRDPAAGVPGDGAAAGQRLHRGAAQLALAAAVGVAEPRTAPSSSTCSTPRRWSASCSPGRSTWRSRLAAGGVGGRLERELAIKR